MSNAIPSVTTPPAQLPAAAMGRVAPAHPPELAPIASEVANAEKAPDPQQAKGPHSAHQARRELHETIAKLNEQMRKQNYNLNFSVDDTTNVVVVKVKNTDSGDVIRQIPTETVLRVAHNLEAVKGLLRDEQV